MQKYIKIVDLNQTISIITSNANGLAVKLKYED